MAKRKRTVLQRGPLGQLQSTYEEEEEQDDAIVADGERVRVRLDMMDALQRDVARHAGQPLVTDGTDNPLALHRPGFRLTADMAQRQAADVALTDCYKQYDADMSNAWRTNDEGDHPLITSKRATSTAKHEGHACSIDGQRGTWVREGDRLVCKPDQQDALTAEDAYRWYDDQQAHAWRT
jgi:hypothetical protein